MRETWYVLETGALADPNEVAPDADGRLRHVSGAAVALGAYGPLSSGISADEIAAARAAFGGPAVKAPRNRQMTAAGGASYKTR